MTKSRSNQRLAAAAGVEDIMKMLIPRERLWQKIVNDPDMDVDAGLPAVAVREIDESTQLAVTPSPSPRLERDMTQSEIAAATDNPAVDRSSMARDDQGLGDC